MSKAKPLTSVYYDHPELKDMQRDIKRENKVFKKLGIKRTVTHGGLLLRLGRLWRGDASIKALIRVAYGFKDGGEMGVSKTLSGPKNRSRKRGLNAKSGG